MSGLAKGMFLGAGGALGLCSQSESLNDVPRFLLHKALNGYDRISVNHSPNSGNYQNGDNAAQLSELQKLSAEMQQIRMQQQQQGNKVIYLGSSSSSMGTLIKVGIVSSTGVAVMYYMGYGFGDVMYVTKNVLKKAIDSVETNIELVGTKLEKAKAELMAKISGVEETIFEANQSLEAKIQQTSEEIQVEVQNLAEKLQHIQRSQQNIELTTEKLDSHLIVLDQKFDASGAELRRANHGIELLVNSVMELPSLRKDLVEDLKGFIQTGQNRVLSLFNRSGNAQRNNKMMKQSSGLLGIVNNLNTPEVKSKE